MRYKLLLLDIDGTLRPGSCEQIPKENAAAVRAVQKAEENGEAQVKTIADKVRAAGFDEAADQMEIFARQEGGHGVRLQAMLDKYQPKAADTTGKKVYVCPVCGYEYVGDINDEDDSYVCPLCGQPKSAFVLKK